MGAKQTKDMTEAERIALRKYNISTFAVDPDEIILSKTKAVPYDMYESIKKYRQGTYLGPGAKRRVGLYAASITVTPKLTLMVMFMGPEERPISVFFSTKDLMDINHRWVLNSEKLSGACGTYEFTRVVYFQGKNLVVSTRMEGVKMIPGKSFTGNETAVLKKNNSNGINII